MDELETLQSISALLAVGMMEARPEPLRVSRHEQPSEVIADVKPPKQETEPRDAPTPEADTSQSKPKPPAGSEARAEPASRPKQHPK